MVVQSRSSASLTVIAPVEAPMANSTAVAVAVGVAVGDGPGEAVVVARRGDGDNGGAVSGRLGEVADERYRRRDVGDGDRCPRCRSGWPVGGLDGEGTVVVSRV